MPLPPIPWRSHLELLVASGEGKTYDGCFTRTLTAAFDGGIAIATAARHPDRVLRLVAAGCTMQPTPVLRVPFLLDHRLLAMLPDHGDALSARMLRSAIPAELAAAIVAGGITTEVIPDVTVAAAFSDPLTDLAAYRGSAWSINRRHDHSRLQERRFHDATQHGTLTVVPGAGHYLPITHGTVLAGLLSQIASAVECHPAQPPPWSPTGDRPDSCL